MAFFSYPEPILHPNARVIMAQNTNSLFNFRIDPKESGYAILRYVENFKIKLDVRNQLKGNGLTEELLSHRNERLPWGDDMAYIVMPVAHGKSTYHDPSINLLESDKVFDCRGSITLSILRDAAAKSGDWTMYDQCYAAELRLRLNTEKTLLMVPHRNLGETLGFKYLGTLKLCDLVWAENLKARNMPLEKYKSRVEEDLCQPINCHSNSGLHNILLKMRADWVSGQMERNEIHQRSEDARALAETEGYDCDE